MGAEIRQINDQIVSIFIPIKTERKHSRATIMVTANEQESRKYFDDKMINAFAKAYKWRKMMEKNARLTMQNIAEDEGVKAAYVGRMLSLNWVAPDIVEAILRGKQPRSLKLQDFMNSKIPDLWDEQRDKFGF